MRLAGTFSYLRPAHILVIGDLMLDAYTIGDMERVSPEAPVGVVRVKVEEKRPGGAGNVALNLVSLGAHVTMVGRVGDGKEGKLLVDSLTAENVDPKGVIVESGYQTPVKNRIIADHQQIVRIDHEEIAPLTKAVEETIISQFNSLLDGVDAVAVSDYGKGTITPQIMQALTDLCGARSIPVVVDPKGLDFSKYKCVTLIKPNLKEAYAAASLDRQESLETVAKRLLEITTVEMLMVTRGGEGISLFTRSGSNQHFKPPKSRAVKDVTGAGDTVLAMLTLALASRVSVDEAAQLANVAAGLAVEQFGCARITLPELAERLLQVNMGNKIFDEEHLDALKAALVGNSFAVVGIKSDPGLTPEVFGALRELRQSKKLLIYLRDSAPSDAFIDMLTSLSDIDFIVQKKDSLRNLCAHIEPESVYVAQANGIEPIENVQELIGVS